MWLKYWVNKKRYLCVIYTVSQKTDAKLLSITSTNNEHFQNSFTVTLSRKLAIKISLQIPPHFNSVATLPCEILMSDNSVPYTLGHCFLKYKLATDMTYDRQQLL